jgi:MoaA/NifB/PqqE/SkfB family radical SAM enzyme
VGRVGFNFLGVSIEGPPEVHDAIRGVQGAFSRARDGIKAVAALRKQVGKACPLIHATTVIQDQNVQSLPQIPGILAEAGADVMNLTLEVRNWELPGIGTVDPSTYNRSAMVFPRIDPQRLSTALQETRRAAVAAGIELRTPDMPDDAVIRYYSGQMPRREFRCDGLGTTIIVGAKGDVYPCWLMKVGNVRERSLKAIWNGPEFRAFRKKTRQGLYGPCVGCCLLVYRGRKGRGSSRGGR